jgi:hypothetical protein
MSPLLAQELVDQIAYYLPYEKGTELSLYLNKKLNDTFGINKAFYQNNLWEIIANFGNLFRLEWIHFHAIEGCTTKAMNSAAENGHLVVVKWLHANRIEGCSTDAMDNAAESGHLEIVKWLHMNRREGCTNIAMDFAARNGHLEIVKWLHANRSEGCTKDATILNAQNRKQLHFFIPM